MQHDYMLDVLTFGRSSIDLYANDIGSPFHEIRSFNAYVGGSSTNIAVGCARLGLQAGLISAVGKDKVGEFIMHFLEREGVNTQYVLEKEQGRSSAVLLGIEPPDKFPLVYYRDNAADILVSEADLEDLDLSHVKNLVISGTALSRDPSRSAVISLLRRSKATSTRRILDLDYRHDQWTSVYEYQSLINTVLPDLDLILGTEEEVLAAFCGHVEVVIVDQQISAPEMKGNIFSAIEYLFDIYSKQLILKSGSQGAFIYHKSDHPVHVPGFPVSVLNVLGAGDAFAAGLLYGMKHNWSDYKTVRMGNACGAYIVTKHGCANFNPTLEEVLKFVEPYGGL